MTTKVFNPRTGLRDLSDGDPSVFDDGSWTVQSVPLADCAQASTIHFLAAVHGEDGFMELRAIASRKGEPIHRRFVALPLSEERVAELRAFAGEYGRTHNIYHGVAPRRTRSSGGLGNCAALRSLFVEIDLKDGRSLVDVWNVIEAFALKPSVIIHSGGGLHVYWLLREPLDLASSSGVAQAYHWLGELTRRLGGDPAAAEPARVLRVPDTANLKPEYGSIAPIVTLVRCDWSARYDSDEIVRVLGSADTIAPATPIDERDQPAVEHGVGRAGCIGLARAWLEQQPPAIEGQNGDTLTYRTCCDVAIGHDLAEDDAIRVLHDWNTRCQPPWTDTELRQKVRNAIRYGKGRRGEKLVEFPTTEAGDAEFFAARYADLVRFDHRRGRWLIAAADGVWEPDRVESLNLLAIEAMRERQRRATLIPDADRRKKCLNWATAGESRKRIMNALAIARSTPPIADGGDGWDRDPHLLGVQNGVVDLRSGELRQALHEERITMRAGVAYDPAAHSDRWEQALCEIFPHEALAEFMQTLFGYSARVQAADLYRAYEQWAGDRRSLNQKTFGQEVRKRFAVDDKRHTWYLGLGLREDRPASANEEPSW